MAKKKNRQRNQMLIVGGVMGVLAIGIVVVAMSVVGEDPAANEQQAAASEAPPAKAPAEPVPPTPKQPAAPAGPPLVADNGRTLWASPTNGAAISLDFLPPDCQLFLHLRLAEMSEVDQAARAIAALGPTAKRLLLGVEELSGYRLDTMTSLTIGIRPGMGESLEVTLVIEPNTPLLESGGEFTPNVAKFGRQAEHAGMGYRIVGPWCYFVPPSENGGRFVVTSRDALHEILDAGGAAPPLMREAEQLLAATDADRHASLLVSPSFLFAEGRGLFAGDTESLRDPLFEETPDDLRAALVSLHWADDRFYWEVKAAPAADTTAKRLSVTLDERVDRWPNEVQLAVLDANPAPYGRRVVAQLPLMMGVAAKYARVGVERRHAVVNGYLPSAAGHNLLLASELLLAQLSAGGSAAGGAVASTGPPTTATTAAEKLRARATVTFARDTLEMAVQYLSDEIDVPIVIVGRDLQLEGITKNQSFGLNAQDKSAEQVLLEILARANPDKTANGPTDPKQKLVYVIRKEGDAETIYITTRSAAEKRDEPLPAAFAE